MSYQVHLPGRYWAGRSYAVSWFLHAQAPGPVCAVHAGIFALWLDPGAGAVFYWPLAMQCRTQKSYFQYHKKTYKPLIIQEYMHTVVITLEYLSPEGCSHVLQKIVSCHLLQPVVPGVLSVSQGFPGSEMASVDLSTGSLQS